MVSEVFLIAFIFMIHTRNSIEHIDNSQFQSRGSFRVTISSISLTYLDYSCND